MSKNEEDYMVSIVRNVSSRSVRVIGRKASRALKAGRKVFYLIYQDLQLILVPAKILKNFRNGILKIMFQANCGECTKKAVKKVDCHQLALSV